MQDDQDGLRPLFLYLGDDGRVVRQLPRLCEHGTIIPHLAAKEFDIFELKDVTGFGALKELQLITPDAVSGSATTTSGMPQCFDRKRIALAVTHLLAQL